MLTDSSSGCFDIRSKFHVKAKIPYQGTECMSGETSVLMEELDKIFQGSTKAILNYPLEQMDKQKNRQMDKRTQTPKGSAVKW